VFDYYICEDDQQSPTCRCDFVGEAEEELNQLYRGYIDSWGIGEYSCQLGAVYVQKMQIGKQQYAHLAELTGYEMNIAIGKLEKEKKEEIQQMSAQAAFEGAGWSGPAIKAIRDREKEWYEYINQVERVYQDAIDRAGSVLSSYEIIYSSLEGDSNQCLQQEYEIKEKQSMVSGCGSNARINNAGDCICQSGYEMSADLQCVAISASCPINSHPIGSHCVCNTGYKPNENGICVTQQIRSPILQGGKYSISTTSKNSNQSSDNNKLHDRVCDRVATRFGNDEKMMQRINLRIEKRFGFSC